jgi:hypothetical protein
MVGGFEMMKKAQTNITGILIRIFSPQKFLLKFLMLN